jgi:dienelactone hydrolase
VECPQPTWQPNLASLADYRRSVETLREQLLARTGKMPQTPAGKLLERRQLFANDRYAIEWVRITSRLPGVSVSGYLARPRGMERRAPAVVVLHGAGVPPYRIFGWRLSGDEQQVGYPDTSPLGTVGVTLAESGYTVFAPLLHDGSEDFPNYFPYLPWFDVSRWGAILNMKVGGDGHGLLVPQVMAAIDFLQQDSQVASDQIALMGWAEGAHVAGITAALDERVAATVWLGPPVDKRALLSDSQQIPFEAPFTMLSCSFGQAELAALIAPRPLLFSYSTSDPTFARQEAHVSDGVYAKISTVYEKLRFTDYISRSVSAEQSTAVERVPLQWLNRVFKYQARAIPAGAQLPPSPVGWSYPQQAQDQQRQEIGVYLAGLGPCPTVTAQPDFSSLAAFQKSVEPLRQQVIADVAGELLPERPIVMLERKTVRRSANYLLEWVRFKGRFPDMELAGYLATPSNAQGRLPAVLSFDGNYGLNYPFGIEREQQPYLNAYGDSLARSGYIVFAPYMPSAWADRWGSVLSAKTGDRRTVWSYLLPLYMSGVDFLLAQTNVDPGKIAAYGISYAGVATLLTTAVDSRVAVLVYANPLSRFALVSADPAFAMSPIWQTELCPYVDGIIRPLLISPRPFIWENGRLDANRWQWYETESADAVSRVYKAIGYPGRFILIRHDGGHETRPWETLPALQSILKTSR